MNAAVNNGKDEPPFEVVIQALVRQHGVFRVLVGLLAQMRPRNRPAPVMLNTYLRRDIGLDPLDDLAPDVAKGSDKINRQQ